MLTHSVSFLIQIENKKSHKPYPVSLCSWNIKDYLRLIKQFLVAVVYVVVFSLFLHVRYVDPSSSEHLSGRSDYIPEHSCVDEPVEFQAGDEHLLRPAAHRQHLRGFWQVQSGFTGLKN